MSPPRPLSPIELQNCRFLGMNEELCFVTTWPTRGPGGYSALTVKEFNRTEGAHRVVVRLLIGRLGIRDNVLHRCGNSQCHNPNHLYVGGDAENHRDKILHQEVRSRFKPQRALDGSTMPEVLTPPPTVLSNEKSRLDASFDGFSPEDCFHADWLHPTPDGYRQLRKTARSGDVVGAHRKIYALFNGSLGKYDIVTHSCADRTCLNPYHLFISGEPPSRRDFNALNDRRCKVTDAHIALMADLTQSATKLGKKLGLHPQTIRAYRRDILGIRGHTR